MHGHTVATDLRLAVDDQVEADAGVSLLRDRATRLEVHLFHPGGDQFEGVWFQLREQGHGAQTLGHLGAVHRSPSGLSILQQTLPLTPQAGKSATPGAGSGT